ncbi:MAG: hypothetical protein MJZ34_02720 [Paludibacteraceae bacterium]|nr:hypothetical protein [Paludibacteraceae bacterium]
MISENDVKRLSFDISDEFKELDTKDRVFEAANQQIEVLDSFDPRVEYARNNYLAKQRVSDYDEFDTDSLQSPELKEIIEKSFNDLGDKHHISVNFKDFTDIAGHLGEYSEKDSQFAKLYVSKMINAVADAANTKAAISLGFLTDRALTLAMKRAQDPNINDLGEIVAVIREIYDWLNKLQDLRDKYNIVGSDKLMSKMSEEAVKESENAERLSSAAIQDIVAQINANSGK